MGTAFSSSLLGLAGSLVVGLLELFASHGQNRFARELEEWLSSITRVSLSSGDGEGGDTAAMAAVLDQVQAQMDALQEQQGFAMGARTLRFLAASHLWTSFGLPLQHRPCMNRRCIGRGFSAVPGQPFWRLPLGGFQCLFASKRTVSGCRCGGL